MNSNNDYVYVKFPNYGKSDYLYGAVNRTVYDDVHFRGMAIRVEREYGDDVYVLVEKLEVISPEEWMQYNLEL